MFSAVTRRYTDARFGPAPRSRFVALVGDAELDEGNVWEAIADPVTGGVANFTLVIDLNRQSLDRVIPGIQARRLKGFFENAGWHVTEAKYGSKLQAAFAQTEGEALREHLDEMSNEAYQRLFALRGSELRNKFLEGADREVARFVDRFGDDELFTTVTDLGGHDLAMLVETFRDCDAVRDRPSVVFAYTIKGWGLPIAGGPTQPFCAPEPTTRSMRSAAKSAWTWRRSGIASTRTPRRVGSAPTWVRGINNTPPPLRPTLPIPARSSELARRGKVSSQDAFGRALRRLADVDDVGSRIVTVAPDVSVTTSLGAGSTRSACTPTMCATIMGVQTSC